jgi:hypothetical protein
MPTKVETTEELDRRRVAALGKYLRLYAPDNRRRQVFTGPKGVTDNSAEYHAEMATLDEAALAIGRELQQARQDRQNLSEEEVHRRALLRGTTKTMERHNVFFDKYTGMIGAPEHTTDTTSHNAIELQLSSGPPPEAIASRLSSRPPTEIESHLSPPTKARLSHIFRLAPP